MGKLGLMNGQTLVNLYIPLPGGETYNIAPGYTRFWHKDWLGTVRLSSIRGNRSVDYDRAFAPFGEAYKNFGTTTNYNFTGDTQDTIAGTFDTANRELDPRQGRWLSPDPSGLAAVDPTNPQSWNRYAYVLNNPLYYSDPTGLVCVWDDGTEEAEVSDGGASYSECVAQGGNWIDRTEITVNGDDPGGPDPTLENGQEIFPEVLSSNAANNGRNCTAGSASAVQYAAATAQVAAMTSEFFSGLGPGNLTFDPNLSTSQVMAQSGPVQEVLNSYYMTGQTSGLYTFGLPGLVSAGGNPVAQFVGSFRWSIAPGNGGINLSLTNTTSFRSLTYDAGPQWQRGSWPTPMGNTHQTYNITAKCQ